MFEPVFRRLGCNGWASDETKYFSVSAFSRSGEIVAAENYELAVDDYGFHVHRGFAFVDAYHKALCE